MATNKDQTATAKPTAKPIGIGDVWGMAMRTGYNSLSTIDAVASTANHLARTAEERAEAFREEQGIANAIKHNALMAELQEQADSLGLSLQ